MGYHKKGKIGTISDNESDIARDIEYHFYGHRFLFTICSLVLCLFVLYLSTRVNFSGSFVHPASTSIPSPIYSFFVFLQTHQFAIRSFIAIPFLLFLNPDFRDLTPTKMIICGVPAIGGHYLLEQLLLRYESRAIPLTFLILWCVAWGFINYDYQQRYNKESDIRKYFSEDRIKKIHEEYSEWQMLDASNANRVNMMQKKLEDSYYRLLIREKKLEALPRLIYDDHLKATRKKEELSSLIYYDYEARKKVEEDLQKIKEEHRKKEEQYQKKKEEIWKEIEELSIAKVKSLLLETLQQDDNYELSFTHITNALQELTRAYASKDRYYSSDLGEKMRSENPKFASFLGSINFFGILDNQLRSLIEARLKIANNNNKKRIFLLRKLIDFVNHFPTFKIPVEIREITLKASRDTIRFLFIISLQALIYVVANHWIRTRLAIYCLWGSLAIYLCVMGYYLVDRCWKETPIASVIERIRAFAFDGLEWLLAPFAILGDWANPIAETILLFTERQYSVSLRSHNPLLLLSISLADISIRTILLTVRMLVKSLRIVIQSSYFLLRWTSIFLTFIAMIPIIFIVFVFYGIEPLGKLIYGVSAEIALSLESNLRRYCLEWILLIIWGLSVNILTSLAVIRISGTYPWISLVTFVTVIISYLVFMFYGALSTGRTIKEEWNYIVQPLSERLSQFIFGFLVLSWVLIGIDRFFNLNHFSPQLDLIVGTVILISLTVIVSITSIFVPTE